MPAVPVQLQRAPPQVICKFVRSHGICVKCFLISSFGVGFGTFGTDTTINKYNEAIEEIADDLENQHVKEIMGISGFGRKAKTFDIVVSEIRRNFCLVLGFNDSDFNRVVF